MHNKDPTWVWLNGWLRRRAVAAGQTGKVLITVSLRSLPRRDRAAAHAPERTFATASQIAELGSTTSRVRPHAIEA